MLDSTHSGWAPKMITEPEAVQHLERVQFDVGHRLVTGIVVQPSQHTQLKTLPALKIRASCDGNVFNDVGATEQGLFNFSAKITMDSVYTRAFAVMFSQPVAAQFVSIELPSLPNKHNTALQWLRFGVLAVVAAESAYRCPVQGAPFLTTLRCQNIPQGIPTCAEKLAPMAPASPPACASITSHDDGKCKSCRNMCNRSTGETRTQPCTAALDGVCLDVSLPFIQCNTKPQNGTIPGVVAVEAVTGRFEIGPGGSDPTTASDSISGADLTQFLRRSSPGFVSSTYPYAASVRHTGVYTVTYTVKDDAGNEAVSSIERGREVRRCSDRNVFSEALHYWGCPRVCSAITRVCGSCPLFSAACYVLQVPVQRKVAVVDTTPPVIVLCSNVSTYARCNSATYQTSAQPVVTSVPKQTTASTIGTPSDQHQHQHAESTTTTAVQSSSSMHTGGLTPQEQEQWCNNDRHLVMQDMSRPGYHNAEVCVAVCRNNTACAWVGFRRADRYCEFWGAGSCQSPQPQSGHDIYKVEPNTVPTTHTTTTPTTTIPAGSAVDPVAATFGDESKQHTLVVFNPPANARRYSSVPPRLPSVMAVDVSCHAGMQGANGIHWVQSAKSQTCTEACSSNGYTFEYAVPGAAMVPQFRFLYRTHHSGLTPAPLPGFGPYECDEGNHWHTHTGYNVHNGTFRHPFCRLTCPCVADADFTPTVAHVHVSEEHVAMRGESHGEAEFQDVVQNDSMLHSVVGWRAGGSDIPQWIILDAGSLVRVAGVVLQPGVARTPWSSAAEYVKTFRVYTSRKATLRPGDLRADASHWTNQGTYEGLHDITETCRGRNAAASCAVVRHNAFIVDDQIDLHGTEQPGVPATADFRFACTSPATVSFQIEVAEIPVCAEVTTQPDGARWKCIFPFTYRGVRYDSCTTTGSDHRWCATQVDSLGVYVTGRDASCSTSECSASLPESADKTVCGGPDFPAPHWGRRKGKCLMSCAARGGVPSEQACDAYHLSSAGAAFDSSFCCRPKHFLHTNRYWMPPLSGVAGDCSVVCQQHGYQFKTTYRPRPQVRTVPTCMPPLTKMHTLNSSMHC